MFPKANSEPESKHILGFIEMTGQHMYRDFTDSPSLLSWLSSGQPRSRSKTKHCDSTDKTSEMKPRLTVHDTAGTVTCQHVPWALSID